MIHRSLQEVIRKKFFKGKVIIIYGARQTGKTTLIKELAKDFPKSSVYLNCDQPNIADQLTNKTSTELNFLTGNKDVIFIDEAQRVKNIGLSLKLLIDNFPEKQIIASGSSSFDLANKINEPLTGRKFEYHLYPFSLKELLPKHGSPINLSSQLEQRMIFGMYPDVVENSSDSKQILLNLTSSYLYKDVFEWQQIRKPDLIIRLLKAIALQMGNEVSYFELSKILGVRKETIISYISLLEKAFVIFRLSAFNRNLRTELSKKQKIYFWDTGIRNTIINNFNPLSDRSDVGALWENFMITERLKYNECSGRYCNSYFWRTTTQQELDYIEEYDGKIHVYEFKWNKKGKPFLPKSFNLAYPENTYQIINKENYYDFVGLA